MLVSNLPLVGLYIYDEEGPFPVYYLTLFNIKCRFNREIAEGVGIIINVKFRAEFKTIKNTASTLLACCGHSIVVTVGLQHFLQLLLYGLFHRRAVSVAYLDNLAVAVEDEEGGVAADADKRREFAASLTIKTGKKRCLLENFYAQTHKPTIDDEEKET